MVKTLIQTIGVSIRDGKVLMGDKERGKGAGLLNFPGGNFDAGKDRDPDACLRREFPEEIGVNISSMSKLGIMMFRFEGKDYQVELHIYRVDSYQGTPRDIPGQDLRNPRYLELNQDTYDNMWKGDSKWMPAFLKGKFFRGGGLYRTERELLEFNIEEVPSL